jgi:DNA-binding CsgD family transcriptional regulator
LVVGFAGFTGRELDVLALLVHGVRPVEIVARLGFKRQRVYELLKGIYSKTGMREVAELAEWAKENALDELLLPESGETRPGPGTPKPRYKQRIKLGRTRGTGTKRRETRMG